MQRQAFSLCGLHPLGDPALEFLYGIAANGKFDEMKRHGATLEHDRCKGKPVFPRDDAWPGISIPAGNHQSLEAAGAGAAAAGASGTGACADFGAACFLPAAGADAATGRGEGSGALAAAVDAVERGAGGGVVPGSGVMMLMGGVEAAEGKSAVVGLPVGIVGISAATGAAGAGVAGAFHDGA
jgi:hypothetical protein